MKQQPDPKTKHPKTKHPKTEHLKTKQLKTEHLKTEHLQRQHDIYFAFILRITGGDPCPVLYHAGQDPVDRAPCGQPVLLPAPDIPVRIKSFN